MRTRKVYHGTNGDNILSILASGKIHPSAQGEIFFAEWQWENALQHGGDLRRGLTFVIGVQISYPDGVREERRATPGAPDTLVLRTGTSINAKVLELHVRRKSDEGFHVTHHFGEAAIREVLEA